MSEIDYEYNGRRLVFETDETLFSPGQIDKGTQAMLSLAEFKPGMKVLDLGCGYGIVGACAGTITGIGNVVMIDVNERAVKQAAENIERNFGEKAQVIVNNGLKGITEHDFDVILTNPPYHTDFCVAKEFIEDGYKALKTGGMIYMVTKRRTWYENKLKSIFGGVRVTEKDGYFVFVSEKRQKKPVLKKTENEQPKMSKKLARKMQTRK